MKQSYMPPSLEITLFAPIEQLALADEDEIIFNMDITELKDLSAASGKPTVSVEGDIFLPFW